MKVEATYIYNRYENISTPILIENKYIMTFAKINEKKEIKIYINNIDDLSVSQIISTDKFLFPSFITHGFWTSNTNINSTKCKFNNILDESNFKFDFITTQQKKEVIDILKKYQV
jgi:hypothetical protein